MIVFLEGLRVLLGPMAGGDVGIRVAKGRALRW